ncbi:MAG: hypothetical protein NTZ37_02710 [Methanoregula sp.]|nr:hypothetical protein [Methanoregula sp.]
MVWYCLGRTPVPFRISIPLLNSYQEELIKYIPAETFALFIVTYGISWYLFGTEPLFHVLARWIIIAGILSTLLYLWKAESVMDVVQLGISAVGFVIRVCVLGVTTIASLPYYNPVPAGLLLAIYVLLAPLINGKPEI